MSENGNGNGNGQLTGLQRAFIDAWFGEAHFNATEAARLAGYSGGDDPEREREVWASQGSRTLRNVKVQEEIDQRWAAHGITPNEVMARLAEQSRATIEDFVDVIEPGRVAILNLDKAKQRGKLHLVKKLYWTEQGPRLELHDAQRATELIGKTMGLFVDRQQVEHSGQIDVVVNWDNNNDADDSG